MNDYGWTDLSVGMSASFDVQVDPDAMASFSSLSGDRNPLHVDAECARRAGYPGSVVFGLLSSSYYSRLVGMYLPGRRALLHGIDIDFRSPAYVGDVLTVSGVVTYLSDAYKRIELKGRIVNGAGKTISTARIRAGVEER